MEINLGCCWDISNVKPIKCWLTHLHTPLCNRSCHCLTGVFIICYSFHPVYVHMCLDRGFFYCSKSEYVRCLHFTCKDTLYVATNNGYLYHARLLGTVDVKWTKLAQLSEEVPIVCMDLLSKNFTKHSDVVDDWVALGDGKGNVTIVRIMGDVFTPEVDFTFTWSAGKERQLLGTYWCKALGCR